MLPADQGLEAEDLAVDLGLRLVMQRKFAARDRRAEIVLQRVAFAQMPVHLRLEEPDDVPAVGLGAIERRIGIGEQRVGVAGIAGDRPLPPTLRPIGICCPRISKGFATASSRRSAKSRRGLRLLAGRRNERELVAADAGDEGVAGGRLQPPGDRAEQLVADGMPEQVVGLLEMVEVDRQTTAKLGCRAPWPRPRSRRAARRAPCGSADWSGRRDGRDGRYIRAGRAARLAPRASCRAPRPGRAPPPCTSSCRTLKLSRHLAELVAGVDLTGTMLTDACAASRSPRPSAAMACENSATCPRSSASPPR